METDTELLSSLSFDLADLFTFAVFLEKCDSPLQAELRALNTICLDKVNDVMWLNDFYEKNSADLSRMVKVPLMVPLFLHDLDSIFATLDQCSDVQDLVLSLFLIIRRIWNAELLRREPAINLEVAKLWPAMLEPQTVESDAPHLDLQQGILKKPLIQLLEDVFLDKKFFDYLLLKLRIRMLLLHLLRGEFGDLERSLQSCNGHCKRVKVHELALMADVASGMWRDLLAVLLGAVHMLFSLALGTFD